MNLFAHVCFHALPINEMFVHNREAYVKTSEERAASPSGCSQVFETYYGCLISKARAEELNLGEEDYYHD